MTEFSSTASPPSAQTGDSGSSSKGQEAKEKVTEQAQVAQQKAKEGAQQASSRIKEQVDTRSTQAGEQVVDTAQALRSTGEQLRSQGKEGPAKAAEQVADRAERLGGYLREADGDRILGDIEDFGRRQPMVAALAGIGLGFAAARFLKASSSERFQRSGGYEGYQERSRAYYERYGSRRGFSYGGSSGGSLPPSSGGVGVSPGTHGDLGQTDPTVGATRPRGTRTTPGAGS